MLCSQALKFRRVHLPKISETPFPLPPPLLSIYSPFSDSDGTLAGDSISETLRLTFDSLSRQVEGYISTADRIETRIRSGDDCPMDNPRPISERVFSDFKSDLLLCATPLTNEVDKFRIYSMSRSVGDLCDRYKAAFLRLSEAGANQWKITEYGEVLESACKATKTCLEESLKYIKTKKNIPDRDTDISGFEYPQEIVGSWEEMYATVKSWFKFMDLNEWNRDYMRKEWLLKVHPLQAKEREMDEAMEDHSKAARNISKFGKMKSSMADLLCRDTI